MEHPGSRFCKRIITVLVILTFGYSASSQRYLSDIDSSYFIKDTVRPVIKRYENLRITGYIQPQFQVAQSKGAPSFEGGNFSNYSASRFMLRRARVKFDYYMPGKSKFPRALFTLQLDATERGVVTRDVFLKLFESSKNLFSITTGLFARPFGYEVNLSSSYRETPERGRMSQILMPSERDLGFMGSFEPLDAKHKLSHIKLDIGLFNGQGLSGTTDFDSRKDLISRLFIKPYILNKTELSGGLSFLYGGWRNPTQYIYTTNTASNGNKVFTVDSATANLGTIAERHYYGADFQFKVHHGWGETEIRTEYWFGLQPGTSQTTSNPGTLPTVNGLPAPTYMRNFNGAFLLLLQNIISSRHQLLLKYDWYDPNTAVSGTAIGKAGTNLTIADIKYATTGIGYIFWLNQSTKFVLYYDIVRNEKTAMAGYTADKEDNILTCRVQFRF